MREWKFKYVSVRVDQELYMAVREVAAAEDRTVSSLLRSVLRERIARTADVATNSTPVVGLVRDVSDDAA